MVNMHQRNKDLYKVALDVSKCGVGIDQLRSIILENNSPICYTDVCGERRCSSHIWRYPEEHMRLRFKLCLVEISLKCDPRLALEYVLSLSLDVDRDNLLVVLSILSRLVTKYGIFDQRILQKCKMYFHLDHLKSAVSRILIAFCVNKMDMLTKLFSHDDILRMNLCDPKSLRIEDARSHDTVKMLFQTVNSKTFKQSKRILRQIDGRFFMYLPSEFTSMGYVHLKELLGEVSPQKLDVICGSISERSVAKIFLPLRIDGVDETYFVHKDAEVRVEACRHIRDTHTMLRFLRVNQFVYGRGLTRSLVGHFRSFIRERLVEHKEELGTLHSEIIESMVGSRNVVRRLLGVLMMDVLLVYDIISLPECSRLLFDHHHEIRGTISKHSGRILLGESCLMDKIGSHNYCDIYGGVEHIRSRLDKDMLDRLNVCFNKRLRAFSDGSDEDMRRYPLYGCIHLFATLKIHTISAEVDTVYTHCFEKLTGIADVEDDVENMVVYWRSLRECCNYYYGMALDGDKTLPLDRLIQTLLHVNHLGTIMLVSEHLSSVFERIEFTKDELVAIIDMCFTRARSCEVVFRKSGGISLLFVAVLKNRISTFEYILKNLFESMEEGNSMRLHCLNILNKFVERGRDELFAHTARLFSIAFDCNSSECWSIRNTGMEIFSNLSLRVFSNNLEHIDDCFLVHNGLRDLFYRKLEMSYAKNNGLLMFLILHVYKRMAELEEQEYSVVRACTNNGGLLALKAKDVINKTRNAPRKTRFMMSFGTCLDEGEILSRLLILLDSEHEEEVEMAIACVRSTLGCPSYSREYLKHCIAKRICKLGRCDVAVKKLLKYNSATDISLNCLFSDSPVNEHFDLDYDLSLFEMYKTQVR